MKKVLILMLGLVASTASFATESTPQPSTAQTHLVMTSEHKIRLYVQPYQTKGQLAILNDKGQSLYASNVALQKGLSRQFDFSNLAAGTYRLTLKTDKETFVKTFVVQTDPHESFVVQES
ncbi:T9SS type A sorting domain-containing protein [Spirosoma fluminis]